MATTKKRAAAETHLYQVLSNLCHDAETYTAGEQIELDALSAEPLLAAGVVKPAEAAK